MHKKLHFLKLSVSSTGKLSTMNYDGLCAWFINFINLISDAVLYEKKNNQQHFVFIIVFNRVSDLFHLILNMSQGKYPHHITFNKL